MLLSIIFTINFGIGTYFACFNWYLKKVLFVLPLVPVIKQQFNELINGQSQTNRAQELNLSFYNDMINLTNFASNLLKIDKKHYKVINVYYIGYIMIRKIDDCEKIYIVNRFHLLVNHAKSWRKKWEINSWFLSILLMNKICRWLGWN